MLDDRSESYYVKASFIDVQAPLEANGKVRSSHRDIVTETTGVDPAKSKLNTMGARLSLWTGTKDFKVAALIALSLLANITLFCVKVFVFIVGDSLAVLASAADSLLDLVSQAIIYFASRGSRKKNEQVWPVGRSRLEPVGIIVCASLMGMAAFQIIYEGISALVIGFVTPTKRNYPVIDGATLYILVFAIVTKAVLFLLCYSQRNQNETISVLYQDHRNDVLSNSVALFTAFMADRFHKQWWLDPIGAIVISIYIMAVWIYVAKQQTDYLVGKTATPDFLTEVRRLAETHHELLSVDLVRAYHFGKRFLVEVEVILPQSMGVRDAHDIAIALQQAIENLDDVERAFVHVDYTKRDFDEHKPISLQNYKKDNVTGNSEHEREVGINETVAGINTELP